MQKKKSTSSKETSWGKVHDWYDEYVENPESYQSKIIEPNLIRILGDIKGKKILDLGCGQGFFSRAFALQGADVTGLDISHELIDKAIERSRAVQLSNPIKFVVSSADDLSALSNHSMDIVVSVLATQNMKELDKVFTEVRRVLKPQGRFIFVINHPTFRVPQDSDWQFDVAQKKQGRIVTRYMSEATVKIDMHPGSKVKTFTYSFHRPLQVFVKWLAKNNLAICRLEEWISHKVSATGPRKEAEDKARKEIPLFMCIEARLLVQ